LRTAEIERDAVGSAQRCLSIARYIPRQSDARREVLQFGIRGTVFRETRVTREVKTRRRIRVNRAVNSLNEPVHIEIEAAAFGKVLAFSVADGERKKRFPTQSGIQRQPRSHLPDVLHIRRNVGLPAAPQYG